MAGKRDAGGLGFDMGALGRLTTPELEGSRIGERTERVQRGLGLVEKEPAAGIFRDV